MRTPSRPGPVIHPRTKSPFPGLHLPALRLAATAALRSPTCWLRLLCFLHVLSAPFVDSQPE